MKTFTVRNRFFSNGKPHTSYVRDFATKEDAQIYADEHNKVYANHLFDVIEED